MIAVHSCVRCDGAVLEYSPPSPDSTLCINCGWRPAEVPVEVQVSVEADLGRNKLKRNRGGDRIATGKPALSGWDRVKRHRTKPC